MSEPTPEPACADPTLRPPVDPKNYVLYKPKNGQIRAAWKWRPSECECFDIVELASVPGRVERTPAEISALWHFLFKGACCYFEVNETGKPFAPILDHILESIDGAGRRFVSAVEIVDADADPTYRLSYLIRQWCTAFPGEINGLLETKMEAHEELAKLAVVGKDRRIDFPPDHVENDPDANIDDDDFVLSKIDHTACIFYEASPGVFHANYRWAKAGVRNVDVWKRCCHESNSGMPLRTWVRIWYEQYLGSRCWFAQRGGIWSPVFGIAGPAGQLGLECKTAEQLSTEVPELGTQYGRRITDLIAEWSAAFPGILDSYHDAGLIEVRDVLATTPRKEKTAVEQLSS